MSTRLGVIGAGNMAEAILRGAIQAGTLTAEDVQAADPSPERRELLTLLGVTTSDDNAAPASQSTVLLAVKPQVLPDVLGQIAPHVRDDAVVVSIAAGVSTAALDAGLGGKGHIVRVMPNTPMLVGAGMSALCAGPRATDDDLASARRLFDASGLSVLVTEAQMDAVTAVSGSGPAYFFYLVEAMVAAGQAEGLDREVALQLARQTCMGAGTLLCETGEDPAELRRRVTSPGGTTQRAIETLDAASAKDTLASAVRAAAQRSRELGAS